MKKLFPHTEIRLPVFPTMGAFAGATGIPMAVLRHAKRSGCPGFDQGGRVHLGPVLRWLFSEDSADTDVDWHARWKRAQALGLEQRLAKERGELVAVGTWLEGIQKAVGGCRQVLFRCVDVAPMELAAAGGDVAKIREVLRKVLWDDFWPAFFEKTLGAATELQADQVAARDAILKPKTEGRTNNEKETLENPPFAASTCDAATPE